MRNFKWEEFKCSCGCNDRPRNEIEKHMDTELIRKLDFARDLAQIPFIITSGYRCLTFNTTIGSSTTSSHIKGYAVDIAVPYSKERSKVVKSLYSAGFTRVGINEHKGFVHVDNDPNKPEALWIY